AMLRHYRWSLLCAPGSECHRCDLRRRCCAVACGAIAVVCSAGGVVCNAVPLLSFDRTALAGACSVREPRLFVVAAIGSGTGGVVSCTIRCSAGARSACRPALPTTWVAAASRAPAGGAASAEAPGQRRAPVRRQFGTAGGECLRACIHERFR